MCGEESWGQAASASKQQGLGHLVVEDQVVRGGVGVLEEGARRRGFFWEEWDVWESAWADWRNAMKEMVDAHSALAKKEAEKQRPEE